MSGWTQAFESDYIAASARIRSAAFGHYREEAVPATPGRSFRPGPLDPQPLPVTPRPTSKDRRYQSVTPDPSRSPAAQRKYLARRMRHICTVAGCGKGHLA
jgi:hypothetical protein